MIIAGFMPIHGVIAESHNIPQNETASRHLEAISYPSLTLTTT